MSITTKWIVVEAGKIHRDAGVLFGELPFAGGYEHFLTTKREAVQGTEKLVAGRDHRVWVSANVLVLQTEKDRILIDTGTPPHHEDQEGDEWAGSRLQKTLSQHGMSPRAITKIVLTSLDIDHAGGMAHLNRAGVLTCSYPKTEVFYNAAPKDRLRPRTIAEAGSALQLVPEANIRRCSGSTTVAPGVIMHPVYGPSLHGCIVEVNRGADRILFMGDLCPTIYHLNPGIIPAYDDAPDLSFAERAYWLKVAQEEGYIVAFGHGKHIKAAWLESRKEGLGIKPVEQIWMN